MCWALPRLSLTGDRVFLFLLPTTLNTVHVSPVGFSICNDRLDWYTWLHTKAMQSIEHHTWPTQPLQHALFIPLIHAMLAQRMCRCAMSRDVLPHHVTRSESMNMCHKPSPTPTGFNDKFANALLRFTITQHRLQLYASMLQSMSSSLDLK